MKLIERECPSCGAPLYYSDNDTTCECRYCHSAFDIISERNAIKKHNFTSIIARIGIPATLVATGAIIATLGFKNIETTASETSKVEDNKPKVTYEVSVDDTIHDYSTSTEKENDVHANRLNLANDIEARAEYLEKAFREYGIINSETNKYYTKEELMELIKYINGNNSLFEFESEEMFERYYEHYLIDIMNSKQYLDAVNHRGDTKFDIHLAEAIIDDKDNELYQLLLYLDDLHRAIINANDDYERYILKEEFKDIVKKLIAGGYEFNNCYYSIDDFNLEDNCFAQALLLEYVLDILPFAPDDELANYFNSFNENSYLKTVENSLKKANTSTNLSI